ncbi:rhodopsin-like [Apostichopus japonicus]|uniref:rhodopsin-like n=1 Tax=Stichopus japonicus TaxID=307972 RepID=UPI003AB87DBC
MDLDNNNLTCSGEQTMDMSNESAEGIDMLIRNSFDTWMYSICLPATAILGTLLNLSFIYVVWKIRDMRNHLNLILINLSVADVAYLMSSSSWKMVGTLSSPLDINFDQSVLGHVGCRLVILLTDFFSFASLFFVTFIAVERYYAVCMPLRHLQMVGNRRSALSCLLVWAISLFFAVLMLPAHWGFQIKCIIWPSDTEFDRFPYSVGSCSSISPSFNDASFALLTIPFFLALFLNLFIYVRIILTLQRRVGSNHSNGESHASELSRKQQNARNAAARMLIVNGLVFFFCNSPFNLIAVFFFIAITCGFPPPSFVGVNVLISISRFLFYLNSAINPLIYGATNHRYRRSFYVTFKCRQPLTPEALSLSEPRPRTSAVQESHRTMISAV